MNKDDCYVYGILRDSILIYVGRGRNNRVVQSMHDRGGMSYMYFIKDVSEEKSIQVEASLLGGLEIKMLNVSKRLPRFIDKPDSSKHDKVYRYGNGVAYESGYKDGLDQGRLDSIKLEDRDLRILELEEKYKGGYTAGYHDGHMHGLIKGRNTIR